MSDDVERPPDSEAPIRWELVARLRAEIAAGALDTPARFEAAVERMMARLGMDADEDAKPAP